MAGLLDIPSVAEEALEKDRSLILEQVRRTSHCRKFLPHRQHARTPDSIDSSAILLLRDRRLWNGAAPSLPQVYCDLLEGLPIELRWDPAALHASAPDRHYREHRHRPALGWLS